MEGKYLHLQSDVQLYNPANLYCQSRANLEGAKGSRAPKQ